MEKLTKEQMKLIVGGDETVDPGGLPCNDLCTTEADCLNVEKRPYCRTYTCNSGGYFKQCSPDP